MISRFFAPRLVRTSAIFAATVVTLGLTNCSFSESYDSFTDLRTSKLFELAEGERDREFTIVVDGESLFVDSNAGAKLVLVSSIYPGGTGGSSSTGGSSTGGAASSGGESSLGGLGGLGGFGGSSESGGSTWGTGGTIPYVPECPWYDTTSTSLCVWIDSSYYNQNRKFTFRLERSSADTSKPLQVEVEARVGTSSSSYDSEGPRSLGVVIDPD